MKIEKLHLERYGGFEGSSFDFSVEGARLHVLYGPNEAGKSTVLSAIADLLFGFHPQTPYNFRYPYASLRVGAEIVGSDGRRLQFRRKKANSKTLVTLGAEEAPLQDGALQPFTGGITRETFARMFGLDHARLREGGRHMLSTNGDLARSLLEAGTGLAGVGDALKALKSEIEELGCLSRRSAGKPIWQKLDEYGAARTAMRQDALRADEWRQAEAALAAAEARRGRADERLAELRARRTLLQRVRRIAPTLATIDELSARLADQRGLPELPADFLARWQEAELGLISDRNALRRAEERLAEACVRLEGCPEPGAVLGFGGDIDALKEELGNFRSNLGVLPRLGLKIDGDRDAIREHLQALGLDAAPSAAAERVPSAPVVAKVRRLMEEAVAAETRATAAEAELSKAHRAKESAEGFLVSLPAPVDPGPADALTKEIPAAARLAERARKASRELANAERSLAEALQRLDGWPGTAEELAARPFPDFATVQLHEEELRQAATARDAVLAALSRAEADIRTAETELAILAAGGEIPSAAAVLGARTQRDRVWRAIRARHIEGRDPAEDDAVALKGPGDVAGLFETAVRRADQLVDERESEAQRVAQLTEATARRMHSTNNRETATAECQANARAFAEAEERWRAAWWASGVAPEKPAAMRSWIMKKDEALRLLAEVRTTTYASEEVDALIAQTKATLASAAGLLRVPVDGSLPLGDLERLVNDRIGAAREAWRAWQDAARKVDAEIALVIEKAAAAQGAAEKLAASRLIWSGLMAELSLPPDAGRPEAEVALAAWEGVRQRAASMRENQVKLVEAEEQVRGFRERLGRMVAAFRAECGSLEAATGPDEAVRLLVALLEDANRRSTRRAGAQETVQSAEGELGAARWAYAQATDASDALRQLCCVGPDGDVPSVARQVEEARRQATDLEKAKRDLIAAGDGFDEETLRTDATAIIADAAEAELAAIEAEEVRFVAESQEAARAEADAAHALEAFSGRRSAAAAARNASDAAQEVGGHLERWLVLTTAKAVLERAVEIYRDENQDPLVLRGSEIFARAAATGVNPIVRLDVSYQDGSQPVLVGFRRDGSRCEVDGMSEGTRDQLFLSLRLAAVERYVGANEPMPFLADDIFVTSDEARVVLGLEALAELGESTQVILFTHHRHVLEASQTISGVATHRFAA